MIAKNSIGARNFCFCDCGRERPDYNHLLRNNMQALASLSQQLASLLVATLALSQQEAIDKKRPQEATQAIMASA